MSRLWYAQSSLPYIIFVDVADGAGVSGASGDLCHHRRRIITATRWIIITYVIQASAHGKQIPSQPERPPKLTIRPRASMTVDASFRFIWKCQAAILQAKAPLLSAKQWRVGGEVSRDIWPWNLDMEWIPLTRRLDTASSSCVACPIT